MASATGVVTIEVEYDPYKPTEVVRMAHDVYHRATVHGHGSLAHRAACVLVGYFEAVLAHAEAAAKVARPSV